MARLEIEIGGKNDELKRILAQSKIELNKFAKDVSKVSFAGSIDKEKLALAQARTEAVKFGTALNASLKESLNNAKVYTEGAKGATEDYKQSLLQARAEIEKGKQALTDSKVAIDGQRLATEKARTETQKTRQEMAAMTLEARKNRTTVTGAAGSYREAQQRLTALGKSIREATGGFKANDPAVKKNIAEYRNLNAQLKTFDASMGNHQRSVGNYGMALGGLSPQFQRLNSQLSLMGISLDGLAGKEGAMKSMGSTLANVGRGIGAFLLSPLGLLIVAAGALFAVFKSGAPIVKEFNSGLINVSKTTGIAGAELNSLGDDLVGLSRSLKTVSVNKLLEYATVAGQLGVKGSANILNFSEALAKLETASDITGEKGGAEIARLLTLTDGGVQNVKSFGDEIVNLGNNFAATESEILGNATAIAQNTGLYKVGRQQVLAYATATKAVGLEADIVGSAMFRTLAQIEKYSNGAKGSEKILNLLGITQAELSKQFKNDASGVFNDLLGALNKINSAGGSVTDTLAKLGLNNIRDTRVLGTLASTGYGQLQEAMENVTVAAGAMDKEFQTKAASLENQTNRISIAWSNLVLNVENGTGAIGKSTVAVVGFFAEILEGITNVVTSSSWSEFFTRINPTNWGLGSGITDIKNWTAALEGAKEQLSSGPTTNWIENEFKALNKGKFNERLQQVVDTYAKLQSASTDYEAAVKSGRIKESKETVSSYKKNEEALKSHIDRIKKIQKDLGFDGAVVTPKPSGGKDDEAEELTAAQIAANARKNQALLKAQSTLQSKINDIIRASNRKELSDEDAKIDAIKDKYRKLAEEISSSKAKVDSGGLALAQEREIAQVRVDTEQKTQDTISAILAKAGVDRIKSREQELAANKIYYDGLERQHRDNEKILASVTEARKEEEFKINETWDNKTIDEAQKLYDKIKAIEEKTFPENLKGDKLKAELAKRLDQIEQFYKEIQKILSAVGAPTSSIGGNMVGSFKKVTASADVDTSELSNRIKNQIGRAFVSTIDNVVQTVGEFGAKSYEIEQKYHDLRIGKTAEQIRELNKLERLEKQIAVGFGTMISDVFKQLSDGITNVLKSTLTESLGKSISSKDFSIGGLSSDKSKLAMAGAAMAGGLVSSIAKPTSAAGQFAGGALSGAASGAAIGSVIPGLGTVAGAIAGGLLGGISGLFGASSARKQEDLMQKQLDEQVKQTALQQRQAALSYSSSISGAMTSQGLVTGINRNALGDIEFEISGRSLKAVLSVEDEANKRGLN